MGDFNPVAAAALAGLFTYALTALGAGAVFLSRQPSRRMLDVSLGFAGGVMIAASFWSLLSPALAMSGHLGRWAVAPVAAGFMLGGLFLRLVDCFLPHFHPATNTTEGLATTWRRSFLLVLAITLHNIPEGLAVGVGFGAVGAGFSEASLGGALSLALGIGLQNLPEGLAVSLPLYRDGFSRSKAFIFGQLSGLVEPVSAVLGALAVGFARPLLPLALAFAAGAMIFVVAEDVIPESQSSGHGDLATLGLLFGFTLMMVLDVALG
ncbi:MAG: ZIP family metal transporter [Candidatus Adiutrix sp.]|jgi:ZIP family zinc transporter|nr:ZIP family metal transporter [Candidatus Adiutrix sp.]